MNWFSIELPSEKFTPLRQVSYAYEAWRYKYPGQASLWTIDWHEPMLPIYYSIPLNRLAMTDEIEIQDNSGSFVPVQLTDKHRALQNQALYAEDGKNTVNYM